MAPDRSERCSNPTGSERTRTLVSTHKAGVCRTQPETLCPRDEAIAPCRRGRPWLVLAAGGHDPAGSHD